MKKVAIILAVFSFILISSIQADIRLGLKAGVNLANTSFNKDIIKTSNFTGFQAGPIVEFDIPIVGIKLDAAVLYSQQGLKLDNMDFEKKESTLDVPVNLKFKFGLVNNLGGFLTAGPYASFKLSGDNFSVAWEGIKNELKNKSFGAGINLGGGIELFEHLQIGVNYKISMTDDYKSLDSENLNIKGKNRIWSVTAAYFF
ncbi:membrane protein [Bacteroidia bacterium]|nr:membrane protein [Bacteroidia bacterium]